MNPLHFYSHLVLAHRPRAREERAIAEEVKDHFRKTLSVDTVVSRMREQLVKRRHRESLIEAISTLEQELHEMGLTDDERVAELKTKIEEMKKKIGPIGP